MAPAIPFSELTTLQVGGPARRLVTATTQRDLVDLAGEAWQEGEPWLALGGGSNLLVGDEGFDGTVIRVATKGIEVLGRDVDESARGRRRRRRPDDGDARHPFACACRPARRGTTSSRGRSSAATRASRRSRASPDRWGPRRCRTSAPTGRSWSRRSSRSSSSTRAPMPRAGCRPTSSSSATAPRSSSAGCAASSSRSSSSCTTPSSSARCWGRRSASPSPTRSSPTRCTSTSATACRSHGCARACSACAPPRAWCSIRRIPTR